MVCSQCGNEVSADGKFCHHCGSDLSRAEDKAGAKISRSSSFLSIVLGLSLALGLVVACVGGVLLLGFVLPEESDGAADLPYALWYGTDGLDGEDVQEVPAGQAPQLQAAMEETSEPTPEPTATPAASPTPSSPQVAVHVGDARTFSAPPGHVVYANFDYSQLPPDADVAWVCSSEGFRYYEWVGIPVGCTYEMTLMTPTSSVGVQFWGDGDDGLARVFVDGQVMWEGDTRGENANWPGGAFVRYVAIDYLPESSHVVRIETGNTGPVTIYFIGTGEVLP